MFTPLNFVRWAVVQDVQIAIHDRNRAACGNLLQYMSAGTAFVAPANSATASHFVSNPAVFKAK